MTLRFPNQPRYTSANDPSLTEGDVLRLIGGLILERQRLREHHPEASDWHEYWKAFVPWLESIGKTPEQAIEEFKRWSAIQFRKFLPENSEHVTFAPTSEHAPTAFEIRKVKPAQPTAFEWLSGNMSIESRETTNLSVDGKPTRLEEGTASGSKGTEKEPLRPNISDCAARALAGVNHNHVAEIAVDESLSIDEKMRRIALIYSSSMNWKSKKWSELLGVSDSRIRQQTTWKKWRESERKPD